MMAQLYLDIEILAKTRSAAMIAFIRKITFISLNVFDGRRPFHWSIFLKRSGQVYI